MREGARIVETGSDRESTGVVGWRRIDPVRIIDQRFGVACWQSVVSNDLVETILLNRVFPTSRGIRGTRPGTGHQPHRMKPRRAARTGQPPRSAGRAASDSMSANQIMRQHKHLTHCLQIAGLSFQTGAMTTHRRHNIHFDDDGLLIPNSLATIISPEMAAQPNAFFNGNDLPERWGNGNNFNIGELGFVTGLNFLTTWQIWQRIRQLGQMLTFTSVEAFPVDRKTARRALAPYEEFGALREAMLDNWETPTAAPSPTANRERQIDAQTSLRVVVKPVEEALAEFPQINAWFLDGFAPAKNPDMWLLPVMQKLVERTAPRGTFCQLYRCGLGAEQSAAGGL